MTILSRRIFLKFACASALIHRYGTSYAAEMEDDASRKDAMEEYIEEVISARASESPLKLQRFLEPVYILLEPINWRPNSNQKGFPSIQAPKGFVTDLASIPRIFWSILPRDAEYAYAAIVHDYLYWNQQYPKSTADEILKMSMEDFAISKATVATIHSAVVHFGNAAWEKNKELKRNGERRVIKQFPPDAKTSWETWKNKPNVF